MSQTVIITSNENRARNIAIGFAVIVVLTWWQITGSLPLLASSVIPDNPDGKVSSVQSFVFELMADGLYLVGAFATAIVSGIWSLGVSLLGMLVSKSQTEKQAIPVADYKIVLDERTDQILKTVENYLNKFDERIEEIETLLKPVSIPPESKRRASGVKS